MKPEREGPKEAILELLREELEEIIRALPEHVKEDLADILRDDSTSPAGA
jgi:hypothetical protein